MTDLIAKSPFFYGGRTRRKGERFTATERHAAMLVHAGRATRAETDEAAPQPVRARRQYRRRDLRAEG
jgi:hypothetical protein